MTDKPAQKKALKTRALKEGRMFLLFGFVGAAAFVVDAVGLKIGLWLGLDALIARIISIAIAMNFAFALNRFWAFKAMRSQSLWRQWIGYILANSLGAVVNYGVFALLVHKGAMLQDMPVLGVAAGAVAGMMVNFAGTRLLAFRH